MKISVTEFRKNLSKYLSLALEESVVVENQRTGVCFRVKSENFLKIRLEEMRAGKALSLDEFEHL